MATLYRDDRTRLERYVRLKGALWATRASGFDSHWRELSSWCEPRRTRFWAGDRNRGDRRNQNIIDSTARFSIRTLKSGMHAGLTSPARPWLKLTTPDKDLAERAAVKEWLHTVTDRLLTVFLQTNLYTSLPIVYGDMGVFGTGAMSVLEDSEELFRTYAYPVGSYALGMNHRQVVSSFCREYELSVRQIVEQFGLQRDGRTIDWSTISAHVQNLWDRGEYEASIPLVWIVAPNEEADPNRLGAKYLPFASCHYEVGAQDGKQGNRFLRESGYRTFPILAPRWEVTGEDTYGTDCPGMTALGDVKQLQGEQREKGKAILKMVNPSLVGSSVLRTQKVSLLPGDITYEDTASGQQGLRSIHEIGLNLQHLAGDIGEVQYRIKRAFYEDLFLMIAQSDQYRGSQPITAREVDERHEEKLLALGPVLERTNGELLHPLVARVLGMMVLHGLTPEPPAELKDVTINAEYISIMAQAQKLVGVVGLDRFVQSTVGLITITPDAHDKIDFDQMIDAYGEMLGVDPRIIIPTEQAKQTRQARAAAAQAQAEAEQAKNLSTAVKNAANSPMGTGSALDQVVGNIAQNASQAAPAPGQTPGNVAPVPVAAGR